MYRFEDPSDTDYSIDKILPCSQHSDIDTLFYSIVNPVTSHQDVTTHQSDQNQIFIHIQQKRTQNAKIGKQKDFINENHSFDDSENVSSQELQNDSYQLPKKSESKKTKCRNVLTNIRKPIIEFIARYSPINSPAFQAFCNTKFHRKLLEDLFKDEKLKNIIGFMFSSRYLYRQYQNSRSQKQFRKLHFQKIKQIEKLFINLWQIRN